MKLSDMLKPGATLPPFDLEADREASRAARKRAMDPIEQHKHSIPIDEELVSGQGVRLKNWRHTPLRQREAITASVRRQVMKSGQCAECGSRLKLCIDHIWPWRLGGSNHILNLRCICKTCNLKKSMNVIPKK